MENSIQSELAETIYMLGVNDIKAVSPFKDLFSVSKKILAAIVADMQKNGFDDSKPLTLWHGNKYKLIDGYTRLEAAKLAGIKKIPVVLKSFSSEASALKYAIGCQKNRRNLTAAEITACIQEVDKLKTTGRPIENKLASRDANYGKSAADTAKIVGVSQATVERTRVVISSATPEIRQAVESGSMSINAAYNATMSTRKPVEPLDVAAEELAKIGKIVGIILERLTKDQIKKLIIRLQEEI